MKFFNKKANDDTEKTSKTPFYKKRSFKFGSMSTAFTAVFVVIVIVINIGISVLAARYPISIDLTKSGSYKLSSETINYLKKVNKPITIKIFATQSEMEGMSELTNPTKIIEQYPLYNKNISIQFIDYDKNPTAVAAYSSESISQYDLIVTTLGSDNKEHYKHISASDLLVTNTDSSTGSTTVTGNQAEQQIDSALDYITTTTLPTIVFTKGHDEATSTYYQNLLKTSNYSIKEVNVGTTAIDSNASAIAIVAPQNDFTSSEISKLDTFLKNGGKYGKNVFIFLDPRLKKLPNLEEYISEWGIKAESGLVYDQTNSFDNNLIDPAASSVDTTVAGSNISQNIGTDMRIARPLTLLFDTKDVRKTTAVIKTSDSSALLTNLSGSPSSSDKKGPFTVMALSAWSSSDGSGKSNMVVSGSYEMMNQDLLSATNKNNAKVLVGIANTLNNKKSTITIASKTNNSSQLTLTTGQRTVIVVLFMFVIPLVILLLGLLQFLRRRHL